jgi:exonuclease VII small subunit
MSKKTDKKGLNNNLKRLSEIAEWFDTQEEVDVEEGLEKVKEAAKLIKLSKERLKEIENEFEDIKREIDEEIGIEETIEEGVNVEGEEVDT